jgi:hypothetical protein
MPRNVTEASFTTSRFEDLMVLAGPPLLVLAQGDEVAVVELEVGAPERDAVVEGELVVDLDAGADVRAGSAAGAPRFPGEVGPLDAGPCGAAARLVGWVGVDFGVVIECVDHDGSLHPGKP